MQPEPTNIGRGVNANPAGLQSGPSARTQDAQLGTKGGRTVPAPLPVTPCFGKSWLFDSVELEDHRMAKALCDTCPVLMACRKNLGDVKRTGGPYGQPEGTWAGLLEVPSIQSMSRRLSVSEMAERIAIEDSQYTEEESIQARRAYRAGDTSEWARVGNRVQVRRTKRNARKKAA